MTQTVQAETILSDDAQWWKSAVVYQIYPRSFSDGNGDGIGDLRGIIQRVPHLVELGVDVVWLSPIYCSPQADAGYDISDYQGIDPLFGDFADFDELVSLLHENQIKLVMDLVVNHTSDEHPWFIESRSSTDNPKRDWYWWRDARAGKIPGEAGAEPTNWESFFSGPTWTLDGATGQYYLHLFAAKQPDLNWENPELRTEIYSMMRWWLDRGVDGFRMDVINLISKDLALPDAVPDGVTGLGDGSPFYMNGPKLHDFLAEMHREVFAGRTGYLTVGEMPGVTIEEALLSTDPARRELDMVFQFEHVGLDHGENKFDIRELRRGALAENLTKWQDGLKERGWNSLYLSNHDQPRAVSRFGNDGQFWRESATALATALHLQRGTPYIYQGEEIGMTNGVFSSIDAFRDIESLNFFAHAQEAGLDLQRVKYGIQRNGRDNARTPVQWNDEENAGFSEAPPWIGVNPNHVWLNAQAQYDDPKSVFGHYRELVNLRHKSRVIAHGTFERIEHPDSAIFAFRREHDGERLIVVSNLSDSNVDLSPLECVLEGSVVLSNYGEATLDPLLARRELRPWEAVVLEPTILPC